MESGTIFSQQDTPAHSFGGEIKIREKSSLNSLWWSLPFTVKGGFYLVADAQKYASLSEGGLKVETEECMGDDGKGGRHATDAPFLYETTLYYHFSNRNQQKQSVIV